jgi:hypothetical protein
VIQCFGGDPLPVQLPFGPFVPVQAQLDAPGCVAAHLDEQRAEILVVDVEVGVVHVDRLVPRELELPAHLLPAESSRLLLCHPDEDDLVPHTPLPPQLIGGIIFAFRVFEQIDRDLFPLGHCVYSFPKLPGHLAQHYRRRDRLAQLFSQERHQAARGRQFADVSVQVQPVQAFHFQRHVPIQQFWDARHPMNSTRTTRGWLVGLRSKTSLVRLYGTFSCAEGEIALPWASLRRTTRTACR